MSRDIENAVTNFRHEIESRINSMLAVTARKLRAAMAVNDKEEIERIISLLETGLEPD